MMPLTLLYLKFLRNVFGPSCWLKEMREWWVRSLWAWVLCSSNHSEKDKPLDEESVPVEVCWFPLLSAGAAPGWSAPGLCIKDWAWKGMMTPPKKVQRSWCYHLRQHTYWRGLWGSGSFQQLQRVLLLCLLHIPAVLAFFHSTESWLNYPSVAGLC